MLKFRPHHFLCTVGFRGMGYSSRFVMNFKEVVDALNGPDGDKELIEVIDHTDAICAACPKKRGLNCSTQGKVDTLDKNHAEALGLKRGDRLTWGEAKELIVERITPETFHTICASCRWKPLGVCESALKDLQQTQKRKRRGDL